jgi:hypothetical protein
MKFGPKGVAELRAQVWNLGENKGLILIIENQGIKNSQNGLAANFVSTLKFNRGRGSPFLQLQIALVDLASS